MAKIAIDIDDTLYAFGDAIRKEFFKMSVEYNDRDILKAAYAPHVEWRSLSDSLPSGDMIYEAILRVHDQALYQRPFPDASRIVKNLHLEGHDIVYISSRLEKYYSDTEMWLMMNGFPQSGNLICMQGSKIPHIRECQYLVDDRPQTVVEFVTDYTWRKSMGQSDPNRQRKAFGLWFPYNQALTDIPNVYLAPNWFGIGYYLKKKGLIGQ